jgi:hypothetical protein
MSSPLTKRFFHPSCFCGQLHTRPAVKNLAARMKLAGVSPQVMKIKLKEAATALTQISEEGAEIFDAVIINDEDKLDEAVQKVIDLAQDSIQKAAVVRQTNHSHNTAARGATGKTRSDHDQPEFFQPEKMLKSLAQLCNQLCPQLLLAGSPTVPGLKRSTELARRTAIEGIRTNTLVHGDYVHEALATAALNLGRCLSSENSEENLVFCKKALTMRLSLFGRDSEQVAEVHRILGGHYALLLDDTPQSLHHWEVSVQILKNVGMTWSLEMADSLFNIGRCYGKQDNLHAKLSFMKKAVVIYGHLFGEDHPITLRARNVLEATKALAATLKGDYSAATKIHERASMLFADGGRRRSTIAMPQADRGGSLRGWKKLQKGRSTKEVIRMIIDQGDGVEDLTNHTRMLCGDAVRIGGRLTNLIGWKKHGTYVLVYFGSQATSEFTKVLRAIYKGVNIIKRRLDILYVGCDVDEDDHNDHIASMPWASVPFDDKARNIALRKRYGVKELPFAPLLLPNAKICVNNSRYIAEESAAHGNLIFPWFEISFKEAVGDTLVSPNGAAIQTASSIDQKIVGVWFPAPPNKSGKPTKFSKTLSSVYNQVGLRAPKKGASGFEVVQVQAPGATEEECTASLAGQPWVGLPFNEMRANKLAAKLGVYSRPCLVIVSPSGTVINRNARAAIETDTMGFIFPWAPPIVQQLGQIDDINSSTVLVVLADGCRQDQCETLYDRLDCLGSDWTFRARANGDEPTFVFAIAKPGDPLAAAVRKTCGLQEEPTNIAHAVILDMRDDRAFYRGEDDTCSSEATLSSLLAKFERGVLKRNQVNPQAQ